MMTENKIAGRIIIRKATDSASIAVAIPLRSIRINPSMRGSALDVILLSKTLRSELEKPSASESISKKYQNSSQTVTTVREMML